MKKLTSLKLSVFTMMAAAALYAGCGPSAQDDTQDLGGVAQAENEDHKKNDKNDNEKVAICHVPPSHDFVLFVPKAALGGHLGHGDCVCKSEYYPEGTGNCGYDPKHGDYCECKDNKKDNEHDNDYGKND